MTNYDKKQNFIYFQRNALHMLYYYNGTYSETAPLIPATDRGFTLGDGCFTTLKIQNGQPQYLTDHFVRLAHHLDILAMPFMLDHAYYHQIIETMIERTHYKNGVMRIMISRGIQAQRGLSPSNNAQPNIVISLSPILSHQTVDMLTACISPIKRNPTSPLSQIKSTSSYLDNILSLKYAEAQGCNEALLLNTNDEACCFTIGNLLIETQDNKWFSPPPASGCIQGITLKHLPYDITYTPITLDMIKTAKNIYRTNSVAGMISINM